MNREEYEAAVKKFLTAIRQNSAGLFVPVHRTLRVEKFGPRLAVFNTYSELSNSGDSVERYWNTLNEVAFTPACGTLSAMNLVLSAGAIDRDAHAALNRTFLCDEFLKKPSQLQADGGQQPDIEVVFTRSGILATFKALLAINSGNKEDQLDLHLIGDLVLLCNDYLGSRRLKTEKSIDDLDLLLEFLPIWELDNPRDVAYGLSRVVRMLKTHLTGNDGDVTKARKMIGLDPPSLTFDELSLDDYIGAIFGLYAHSTSLNLEAVFKNPGEGVIDPDAFVSKTNFPQEILEKFLAARSLSPEEFHKRIAASGKWEQQDFPTIINSDDFGTNTLLIKTYPLLQWTKGRTLILDSQYVSEILIYGLYWRIVDSLDSKKADVFISLWGRLLELYLYELLNHFYPQTFAMLATNVQYDGGQIDALLDLGPDVILFEFKASLLKDATKHKRDRQVFEKEIGLKFIQNQSGAPKALRQLANAAVAIRNETVKTTIKPERLFPVLVGYEPTLETFSMNTYLHEKFRPFISAKENEVSVLPLTVMSVDEFEGVLPNIQAATFTWPELLGERFDHDRVRAFSIHQTVHDLCQKKGAEIQRNQFLLDQFESIFKEIASRYH
jgi:hypothetical protein